MNGNQHDVTVNIAVRNMQWRETRDLGRLTSHVHAWNKTVHAIVQADLSLAVPPSEGDCFFRNTNVLCIVLATSSIIQTDRQTAITSD